MLHRGESCKGGYALRSFEGERACSTQTRQPAWLCIHFQLLTAGCNENVCSFTSIVYSCKRAWLTNIEGGHKDNKTEKEKRSLSQCLNSQWWICVLKFVSDFINKCILIRITQINITEPSDTSSNALRASCLYSIFCYDPGLNLSFDFFSVYFYIILCLL